MTLILSRRKQNRSYYLYLPRQGDIQYNMGWVGLGWVQYGAAMPGLSLYLMTGCGGQDRLKKKKKNVSTRAKGRDIVIIIFYMRVLASTMLSCQGAATPIRQANSLGVGEEGEKLVLLDNQLQ